MKINCTTHVDYLHYVLPYPFRKKNRTVFRQILVDGVLSADHRYGLKDIRFILRTAPMSTITTNVELAADRLRAGEIVAIPTETVYGLAGNAENESAIKKIYALKNRPLNHPLIMHVAHGWDISQWARDIPDYASVLMERFWPGALTLVMNCRTSVNPLVTGGQTTVALRCPSHPVAQALLSQLGKPLVAPSANPFGKISPTTAEHVRQSFAGSSLLILDGGRCDIGIESTIIAATHPEEYQVLRPGMIDEEQIQAAIPIKEQQVRQTIRAPGMLANHYQPEKPLYCFNDRKAMKRFCQQSKQACYVLSFVKDAEFSRHQGYQLPLNPRDAAFELYFQLRRADQSSATIIVLELPPETAAWHGIRERAIKAGQIR
ncbi:translation initiation protein [Legionella spiritensis]|uniref:Threonylcarbamoyl-AMP synthase n=2 Tax=Legionella spiritensis TaxID=452 RepID=A0A0W0Z9Y4_LEGSP|nr:translation initiation protein [Legionella spiritensis]SNV31892.1 translation initiation protein [Legionella spiritensis]